MWELRTKPNALNCLAISLNTSLVFFETGALIGLELTDWTRLANELPGSTCLHPTALGLQMRGTMPSFYVGAGDPNLGSLA